MGLWGWFGIEDSKVSLISRLDSLVTSLVTSLDFLIQQNEFIAGQISVDYIDDNAEKLVTCRGVPEDHLGRSN